MPMPFDDALAALKQVEQKKDDLDDAALESELDSEAVAEDDSAPDGDALAGLADDLDDVDPILALGDDEPPLEVLAELEDLDLASLAELDPFLSGRGIRSTPLDLSFSDGDDAVSLYLREIGSIPLLTADDEKSLAQAYQAGRKAAEDLVALRAEGKTDAVLQAAVKKGLDARERLIQANSRLVVHIARKDNNKDVPQVGGIQEGNVGLIGAGEEGGRRRGGEVSRREGGWLT